MGEPIIHTIAVVPLLYDFVFDVSVFLGYIPENVPIFIYFPFVSKFVSTFLRFFLQIL